MEKEVECHLHPTRFEFPSEDPEAPAFDLLLIKRREKTWSKLWMSRSSDSLLTASSFSLSLSLQTEAHDSPHDDEQQKNDASVSDDLKRGKKTETKSMQTASDGTAAAASEIGRASWRERVCTTV